jgi:hypothetical protein
MTARLHASQTGLSQPACWRGCNHPFHPAAACCSTSPALFCSHASKPTCCMPAKHDLVRVWLCLRGPVQARALAGHGDRVCMCWRLLCRAWQVPLWCSCGWRLSLGHGVVSSAPQRPGHKLGRDWWVPAAACTFSCGLLGQVPRAGVGRVVVQAARGTSWASSCTPWP